MTMTPQQYAAFITTVDTTIGSLWLEMDPMSTYKRWADTHPMPAGSVFSQGWTGRMPKARPWFGSRVLHEPAPQTYQVTPVPYELTYGIDRFILDDSDPNAMSIFWRMLPDMALQWRRQPEYELRDLLESSGYYGQTAAASRQNGMDQVSFFNTAHPIDFYNPGFNGGGNALFASGTFCNDFTGGGVTINGTLIGGPLGITQFTSLLEYSRSIPDESGETLGIMAGAVMVPFTLEVEARFILKATMMAPPTWGAFSPLTSQVGAADNQLAKMGVDLIVNPWLRNTKRWYLMDIGHSVKGIRWLVREAARTVPRINENDPIVFDSHRYTWGGWDRVAPFWGPAWLLFRSGQ